ncbi:MAG: hypothetical protein WAO08_26305 [Hyphomicrobiaceae bacterium]
MIQKTALRWICSGSLKPDHQTNRNVPSAMMHNQNTVICAGKKPRWLRIGVAFPYDRGAGLTVVLNALQFRRENFLLEPPRRNARF